MLIKNFFNDCFFIIQGVKYVIFFSFLGFIIGLFLATILTIINVNTPFKHLVRLYVSIFRGIPLVCQIGACIYLFPDWFSINVVCLLVFSLNTSAYFIEIFRNFINNLPVEQMETAIGLGLNKYQITRYIIFPQMFQSSIPLFIVELISLSKDVAILGTFGVMEIFTRGKIIGSLSYNYGRSMIIVGVVYYLITFLFSQIEHLKIIKKYIKK